MIKIWPKRLFISWTKRLKLNLNFLYIEARTLIKIIVEKFKERSSFGAKYDRWLSPEKESTVNHYFDSV